MSRALIDADILRYEVGFGSEWTDEDGEKVINPFEKVAEMFDQRIDEICAATETDEEPHIYITADTGVVSILNRERKRQGKEPLSYFPNYREEVATTKVYKGNRVKAKPFHFNNLTAYIVSKYNYKIAVGIEADDLLSIEHVQDPEGTIICSRDKDLRITPGMHYGWECGKQPSFGPEKISEFGYLELGKGKVIGGGLMFFYSQMLTGDAVDNIPGLPKIGPVAAYKALSECQSEEELFDITTALYKEKIGDNWKEYFLEQADLLWIMREVHPDGAIGYDREGLKMGGVHRPTQRFYVWVPEEVRTTTRRDREEVPY